LTPVMSAAMPPDALHRAIATAIRSVIETPARLALAIHAGPQLIGAPE
jgi:hypothetical protein